MRDFNWTPVSVFGVIGLIVVLIIIGLVWSSNASTNGSNGELIYFQATNDRGERITYRGGSAFLSPGMMMDTGLSCASCHGQNARGGVHMMYMQVMDSPDIHWSALAGEIEGEHDEEAEPRDEHAEAHAEYDLENFRMAVVEGKHPNGELLSSDMPRWNIGDGDLEDLAEFLKSDSLTEKGEKEMNFMSGGAWIIFPMIGIIFMGMFVFMMFNRRGGFMSRQDEPRFRSDRHESRESETPLSILKKRYAKGEISKEEYEEMKREF